MTNEGAREGHGPRNAGPVQQALDEALGREPGRVLSVLLRSLRDFDLAEDALQDAVAAALERWPTDGIPSHPAAWLVTTARRRAIDRIRRANTWERNSSELRALRELEAEERRAEPEGVAFGDERLRLIFTCCHPALEMGARVALTLRIVGGLTTAQVARAFLCSEETMKKRLSRTKKRIRDSSIPYTVPSDDLLATRLEGVLSVLYLIFNEGYIPTHEPAGDGTETGDEAIRLARLVANEVADPEARALLALMLFQHARRRARTSADGQLVLLDAQDRSLWDSEMIEEARALLDSAADANRPGPYQLQAAIASEHALAEHAESTDWLRIATLYDRLLEMTPGPVLALNRAVAHGRAFGPAAGLLLVDGIEGLDRYHLLHATRADFLRRLDRGEDAVAAYELALRYVTNETERAFLAARLAECRTQ